MLWVFRDRSRAPLKGTLTSWSSLRCSHPHTPSHGPKHTCRVRHPVPNHASTHTQASSPLAAFLPPLTPSILAPSLLVPTPTLLTPPASPPSHLPPLFHTEMQALALARPQARTLTHAFPRLRIRRARARAHAHGRKSKTREGSTRVGCVDGEK